ncbi:inhibin beta C chain-like [Pogoniulus pusillus]|uniref:inhibin beta C chain-like n=1 Tax=Pogoniulus pusillus TaxID=488313 RepID=UPI0030B95BBF
MAETSPAPGPEGRSNSAPGGSLPTREPHAHSKARERAGTRGGHRTPVPRVPPVASRLGGTADCPDGAEPQAQPSPLGSPALSSTYRAGPGRALRRGAAAAATTPGRAWASAGHPGGAAETAGGLIGQSEELCPYPSSSCHLLAPEMSAKVAFLLLSLLRMTAPKGMRCPACGLAALAPSTQQDVLKALAKQSILSKLRLPDRPNITQPVPRGALLTALHRLRAQHTDAAEPSGIPRDGNTPRLRPGVSLQEYEILSFAESGRYRPPRPAGMEPPAEGPLTHTSSSLHLLTLLSVLCSGSSTSRSVLLHFLFTRDLSGSIEILQATLYLFWTVPGLGTHPVTVRLLQPDPTGLHTTVTSETRLQVPRSGWTTLDVGAAVQQLFGQGSQRLTVELEVPEARGSPLLADHSDSRWPFVAARARARAQHHVQRRGIDCSGDSRMCCRREFFVDFKEIGWEDWIIHPEGYHMNYCAGLCPRHMAAAPGLAASFHTAVLNLIKATNAEAAADSCCVPTQRRPLSLLYYDRDSNIVKTDIPDMIVDACGCT